MGKHNRTNYSGFYSEPKEEVKEVVEETPVEETATVFIEMPDTEVIDTPKDVTVKDTALKLYVRSEPYTAVDNDIAIVEKNDKRKVGETLEDWYKVITPSGDEGYVMKAYVEI